MTHDEQIKTIIEMLGKALSDNEDVTDHVSSVWCVAEATAYTKCLAVLTVKEGEPLKAYAQGLSNRVVSMGVDGLFEYVKGLGQEVSE